MANQAKVAAIYAELQLSTAKFKAALGEATNETRRFSAETRKSSEEARASIALLGEEIGVRLPRHLRSFVAELPGVGKAMSAAFEAVAVIALIDVVVEAGKKLYEFVQKNEEAAKKNADAWAESAKDIKEVNTTLEVSNEKIADTIAKLEHKPGENGIKSALMEASEQADKLGEKLDKDLQKLSTVRVSSGLSSLFTGGTSSTDKAAGAAAQRLQTIIDEYSDVMQRAAERGDTSNYNTIRNEQLSRIASDPQFNKQLSVLTEYLRQNQNLAGTGNQTFDKASSAYNILSGAVQALNLQQTQELGNQKVASLTNAKDANAALEQEDAKRLKGFEAALEREKQLYGMSVAQERAFWEERLRELHSGTGAYHSALEKFASSSESLSKQFERIRRSTIDNTPLPITEGIVSTDTKQRQVEVGGRIAEQQAKMNASLSEATTKYQLATGQINAHTAAVENATAHEAAFNASLKVLLDELAQLRAENDGLLTADEHAKNVIVQQQLNAQIEQLNAVHRAQQLQDALATESAADQMFNHIRQGAQNIDQKIVSIMERTLDGLNDQFVNGLFGDKTNFRKVFEDSEKSLTKVGLQWAEGLLTGKKPGSTGKISDLKLSATDGSLNVHLTGSSIKGASSSSGTADDSSPFSSIPGLSGVEDSIKNSAVGQWLQRNGSTALRGILGAASGLMTMFQGPEHFKGEGSGVRNALADAGYKQNALSRFLAGAGQITSGIGSSMFAGAGGTSGLMSTLNDSDQMSSLFGGRLFGSGGFFGSGYAVGGDVTYGGVYPVGELGPEKVYLPGGSHVVPNKDIAHGGQVLNIDARGTDPALTQANVARAIASSNAHAVSQAQAKIVDRQRRVPRG